MSPFRASAPFTENWHNFDVAIEGRVLTITLNRPERLNALTFDAYADLRDLFAELPHRDLCDVVVLTGAGKGFCSGGDVDEIIGQLLSFDSRDLLEFTKMTGAVVWNMKACPIPIIAAVNGVAAGAGAVLALAADFRILSTAARFRFLFTSVGLSGGDMGTCYLLPRLVGLGRATEILLLGEPITAEEAVRIGLAGKAVAPDQLASAASELAQQLVSGPTFAYRATKVMMTKEADMDLAGALDHEAYVQALLMTGRDHAEFHRAFKAEEAPRWTGR